jgi:bacterioferritin-associated ferredoxin
MCVNRCICTNLTFAELIVRAQRDRLTFESLRQCTGAAGDCGLCEPYLKAALRTGRTSFPVMTTEELDQLDTTDPS